MYGEACSAQVRMLFGEFIYADGVEVLSGTALMMYWLYAISFMLLGFKHMDGTAEHVEMQYDMQKIEEISLTAEMCLPYRSTLECSCFFLFLFSVLLNVL